MVPWQMKYLSMDPEDGTKSDAFVRMTWERLVDISAAGCELPPTSCRRQPCIIVHYLGDETLVRHSHSLSVCLCPYWFYFYLCQEVIILVGLFACQSVSPAFCLFIYFLPSYFYYCLCPELILFNLVQYSLFVCFPV